MGNSGAMHQMFWGGMGGWMVLWWILLIAVIVGVISFTARQGKGRQEKSALDILKERYARGEISHKEFEEKKHSIV